LDVLLDDGEADETDEEDEEDDDGLLVVVVVVMASFFAVLVAAAITLRLSFRFRLLHFSASFSLPLLAKSRHLADAFRPILDDVVCCFLFDAAADADVGKRDLITAFDERSENRLMLVAADDFSSSVYSRLDSVEN
jgi:hypothetical protein